MLNTTINITADLEVGNAEELLSQIANLWEGQDPTDWALFVPEGSTPDLVGNHKLIIQPILDETPEGFILLATGDYWATLWDSALENKKKLENTGDPDDIHGDEIHLYYVIEDLALGL